jgi:hypothetical protein
LISKEQYGEWRNHPATLFFRKFLKDRREQLIHAAHETWLNDPEGFARSAPTFRGRILELFEIEDIPYEAIQAFYHEEQNGSEGSQG